MFKRTLSFLVIIFLQGVLGARPSPPQGIPECAPPDFIPPEMWEGSKCLLEEWESQFGNRGIGTDYPRFFASSLAFFFASSSLFFLRNSSNSRSNSRLIPLAPSPMNLLGLSFAISRSPPPSVL